MQIKHTINDTKIHIQIINEDNYYETEVENNSINKDLIVNKNNKFLFQYFDNKLIMYDEINTFELDKLDFNYKDYIDLKDQLEYSKYQLEQIKKEIKQIKLANDKAIEDKKELTQLNNDLHKQIKNYKDITPIVFCTNNYEPYQLYYDKHLLLYNFNAETKLHNIIPYDILNKNKIWENIYYQFGLNHKCFTYAIEDKCFPPKRNQYRYIIVPPNKILITFSPLFKIYKSGIYHNIIIEDGIFCCNEEYFDDVFISLDKSLLD
jgi:hypothetical protein